MIDIGEPGVSSGASAINDHGVVVGSYSYPGATSVAFIYHPDFGRRDLIDLLGTNSEWSALIRASDINNRGQIFGTGRRRDSYLWNAFLMTPVPEPSATLPVAVACLSAVLVRSNRRRPR